MALEIAESVGEPFATGLKIGSGICWTIAYILIIRRGFRDKRTGMPLAALCANISWEFIFSFIFPHSPPQLYVDYVWLLFDTGIVIQFLMFGRKDFPDGLPSGLFYPAFLLSLAVAFAGVLVVSHEFEDYNGIYAAFGQNLMMSILFVGMLLRRDSAVGQSIYIALFKMIGTILPSILLYMHYPHSYLLLFLYISIFMFDLVYVALLYGKIKQAGMNPWKRL